MLCTSESSKYSKNCIVRVRDTTTTTPIITTTNNNDDDDDVDDVHFFALIIILTLSVYNHDLALYPWVNIDREKSQGPRPDSHF